MKPNLISGQAYLRGLAFSRRRRVAASPRHWLLPALLVGAVVAHAGLASKAEPPAQPNVVLILADDLGFSDIGCYGGEIATPNLDRLAAGGLRFTQAYNTARCWPTRAALMTGYYPQQVNRDPGRKRPAWAVLLPELLEPAGYRSYHSGKWHIDGKVLDAGFHRSYYFRDWDRYHNPKTHFLDDVKLPEVRPDEGYYATTAIAQHAIDFLGEHAQNHADQPFLLYLAFIAPHFPLHALPEDIARYRDRYLEGWDVLRKKRWEKLRAAGLYDGPLSERDPAFTPRYLKPNLLEQIGPGEVLHAVAWDELTPEQKRLQATKMAIHAAMVDRMDREIGRVLDQIRGMGAWDNTLIVFLSDNGADATLLVRGDGHDQSADPGSAGSFLCLGPGFATASNAPFRRHKIWVHEGGIATPFIVHWPAAVRTGGQLRRAATHIIDFVPTVLELAGVSPPQQMHGARRPDFPGLSLVPVLREDVPLQRECLWWKHEGNRALRSGNYKLVSERENDGKWELYDLSRDRIESQDLSSRQPDKVRQMAEKWQQLDETFARDRETGAAGRPTRSR